MSSQSRLLRSLLIFALGLALVVVGLGAYTRLKDAGLGCPDWPLCYGRVLTLANSQSFSEPLKASLEMVHRYAASLLGLSILGACYLAWKRKQNLRLRILSSFLLILVCVQGLFGMWTVTLKLHPLVVSTHLLLGFLTVSTLFWTTLASFASRLHSRCAPNKAAYLLLLLLITQIFLGAWTSSNYAALACPDFPTCGRQWIPPLDFAQAFNLFPQADNYEFGILNSTSRMTIHFSHRIVAALLSLAFIAYLITLWKSHRPYAKRFTLLLGALLGLQVTLGILNVVSHLQLHNAVAHNLIALLLLLSLIAHIFFSRPPAKNYDSPAKD